MSRASARFLSLALLLSVLAACAIGNRLYISGELGRPGGARKAATATPQVAVLDFAYDTVEPGVVGRDFDHVRPIDWKGEPGKAMADLVAGVLAEKGVSVVRAAAGSPSVENVPARVTGYVNRFEVNARRKGTVKIVTEATVSLSLTASGGGLSSPVSTTTTSSNSMEDVFVTPEGAREVLFASANSAAEEAARRILDAGVVASPSPGK
ncbi:MAG TPA: hypothetical protein VF853_11580 [Candidatus Deferrimicrobiaceae bacterium]